MDLVLLHRQDKIEIISSIYECVDHFERSVEQTVNIRPKCKRIIDSP